MSPRERHRPVAQSPLVPKVESVGPVVEATRPAQPEETDPLRYFSSRLRSSLHKRLHHAAVEHGLSVQQILDRAVSTELDRLDQS